MGQKKSVKGIWKFHGQKGAQKLTRNEEYSGSVTQIAKYLKGEVFPRKWPKNQGELQIGIFKVLSWAGNHK